MFEHILAILQDNNIQFGRKYYNASIRIPDYPTKPDRYSAYQFYPDQHRKTPQHTTAIPVLYSPSVLYVPDSHTPHTLVVTVQYPYNSVPNALNTAFPDHKTDYFLRNYYSVQKCFEDFSDYCHAFAFRSYCPCHI